MDACDLENRTALHSASWQGHHDIVRLLLEHGALPDHTCNQGATALGIAAQEGHELCVVALLEHGADPNHSDSCGRNALRVAAKSGHRGVVRLIEEYNVRSHKVAHTSSSANSITSGEIYCIFKPIHHQIDCTTYLIDYKFIFFKVQHNALKQSIHCQTNGAIYLIVCGFINKTS